VDSARATRLQAIARYFADCIEDDWDQPHAHELRQAIGRPEKEQRQAAMLIKEDLEGLIEFLGAGTGDHVAVRELTDELQSLEDGRGDEFGTLMNRTRNMILFLRTALEFRREALAGLLRARSRGTSSLLGGPGEGVWQKAKRAVRPTAVDAKPAPNLKAKG
jgi:hypothetical protein